MGVGEEMPGFTLIDRQADLLAVLDALGESTVVGLDLETTGLDPCHDRIRLLSLCQDNNDGGRSTWLVDCFAVDPRPLFEVLRELPIIGHNLAFDLGFLARLGFEPGPVQDTLILDQLLTAGAHGSHKLQDVVQRELGRVIDKAEQLSDWSGVLTPQQLAYAAADVDVLVPLYESLTAKIKAAGLDQAADVERRCLPGLVWLSRSGVAFDRPTWEALAEQAALEAAAIAQQLDSTAPERSGQLYSGTWNWDSPAQVIEAFKALGITLNNADDDALAKIEHPLADLLRQHRSARKRCSTYGTDWLKHVADDGRVYCSWRQMGARTGRMSSGNPNLQQVPQGEHRRCFRAPPGRNLIKADYSQIELRIAAKVANEQRMLDAYQRGDDLHTLTARQLTGKEQVSKAERQMAKPVNFGLIYGMGNASLQAKAQSEYKVELTTEQVNEYRQGFFRAWPGIDRWHRQLKAQVNRKVTETRTLTGRRVQVDGDFWHGGRANYIVQGTGGDGIKLALALLWERRHLLPTAFPVLVVHDEIVIEADADQADTATAWLKQAMIDAMAPLIDPVPVEVEVKIGTTWGGD